MIDSFTRALLQEDGAISFFIGHAKAMAMVSRWLYTVDSVTPYFRSPVGSVMNHRPSYWGLPFASRLYRRGAPRAFPGNVHPFPAYAGYKIYTGIAHRHILSVVFGVEVDTAVWAKFGIPVGPDEMRGSIHPFPAYAGYTL